MVRYIIRRLLWVVVLLFLVSLITFVVFYELPSADPASCAQAASQTLQAAPEPLVKRLPLEQLHDDEYLVIVGFTDVIYRADVGVLQSGNGACLALQTLACRLRRGEMRRKYFDRDRAIQPRVACLVDLAHPA